MESIVTVNDQAALRILGRMNAIDDYDYLADHGAEPMGCRDSLALRSLLLEHINHTGTDYFCDAMGWMDV